jgi:hypothetical protein
MINAVRSCPASFIPSSDIAHAMKLIIDIDTHENLDYGHRNLKLAR